MIEALAPLDDEWLERIAEGTVNSVPRLDLWSLAQEVQRARQAGDGLRALIDACVNCQGRGDVLQLCINGTEPVACPACAPLRRLLGLLAG